MHRERRHDACPIRLENTHRIGECDTRPRVFLCGFLPEGAGDDVFEAVEEGGGGALEVAEDLEELDAGGDFGGVGGDDGGGGAGDEVARGGGGDDEHGVVLERAPDFAGGREADEAPDVDVEFFPEDDSVQGYVIP